MEMIYEPSHNYLDHDAIHEREREREEEFEDTKWVIIIGISKNNKQHNDQNKKYKGTNSDLHNSSTKTSSLSLSMIILKF
jgi:hypothetical protein